MPLVPTGGLHRINRSRVNTNVPAGWRGPCRDSERRPLHAPRAESEESKRRVDHQPPLRGTDPKRKSMPGGAAGGA